MTMQLDIFNDSSDVMLRNDLLQALQQHDVPKAQVAWLAMQRDCAGDGILASAQMLLDALQTHARQVSAPALLTRHDCLKQERLALLETVAPATQRLLGQAAADHCLRPLWQHLVARAASLPFDANQEADHAVPILLHLQDWQGALDAVTRIESWRHIPAPLAWMAQAKLHLRGLHAAWPLLAELAWLAPRRLDALIQTAGEPMLQRLKDRFDASFEPSGLGTEADQDITWFPAWVLTLQPHCLPDLALAQPGQHSAPEQAMRLLVNLLGLERQGRHHDIVAHRKSLRDLNGWLYAQHMKSR